MSDENHYDVIIVGAGPAGLTSAIYACRAEKKTLVLEKNAFGGQIVSTKDIENYPGKMGVSGFELAKEMYDQAVKLGAKFEFEKVTKISNLESGEKKVETEDDVYFAKAVIIATGAKNRQLGLKNEERLTGRGISYCATCDGAFYKGKTVAVQGGGNVAVEDAIYLSDLCEKVYLVHWLDEFQADEKNVSRLKSLKNVEIILGFSVSELEIDETKKLSKVKIKAKESDEERELEVSGLFVAIGQIPETEAFSELIKTNKFGYFDSKEDCLTNVPGIFVAGDCREKSVRQLVTATSDGAISAISAISYLNK
ncbi:thioredoxin-disulfide reductase [Candidatus Saccharibacteria bacterium]|nr:thioredoxin-disulfide reductase [Candidatus Saccharibacteria bacterium]